MADGRWFITVLPREVFTKVSDQLRYVMISSVLQHIGMKEMGTVASFTDNLAF